MNDITEITTILNVQTSKDSLRMRFPRTEKDKTLKVYNEDNEEVFHDWWPEAELVKMFTLLCEDRDDYRVEYREDVKLDTWNILIPDHGTFHLTWVSDDVTSIRIRTHGNDEERHYKKLDEVRQVLEEAGYDLGDGKCTVTYLKEC